MKLVIKNNIITPDKTIKPIETQSKKFAMPFLFLANLTNIKEKSKNENIATRNKKIFTQ